MCHGSIVGFRRLFISSVRCVNPSISVASRLSERVWQQSIRLQSSSSVNNAGAASSSRSSPPPPPKPLSKGEQEDNELIAKAEYKPENTLWEVKRLLQLAWPQKRKLYAGVGLLFVSASVSMSVPLALGKTLDVFTKPEVSAQLPVSVPVAASLLCGFLALGSLATFGRVVLMRVAGQSIIRDARQACMTNILRQDMPFFDLQGEKPVVALDQQQQQPSSSLSSPASTQAQSATKESARDQGSDAVSQQKQDHVTAKNTQQDTSLAASQDSIKVRSTGDIISRLSADASMVGDALTRELTEGLFAVFSSVVGIGLMLYISVKLSLLSLILIPPMAIGAVFYGRYVKRLSLRTQRAMGDMVAFAEERLAAIRTVHAFNGVTKEFKGYEKRVDSIFDLLKKEAWASACFFSTMQLSGYLTGVCLLGFGGALVARGELSVGELSAMSLYALYVGRGLGSLTSFYSTIMRGLGASARLFEIIDAKPRQVFMGVGRQLQHSEPMRPVIFNNVSFQYPSRPGSDILSKINLTIQPGESVAIAGSSGSGKSTIARLLLRFYDPSTGTVRYGDEDIKDFSPESWRERVAYVDQEPVLWGGTVAENIAYGQPEATLEEIEDAARAANCLEFIRRLPDGFETDIGRGGRLLSGGQKQRIAIARALLKKPKMLVMDEATSALDSQSEHLINDSVARITASHGLTTIIIAHRLSTLKGADRIVFLEHGQLVESGTFAELSKPGSRFSQMVSTQLLPSSASSEHSPQVKDSPTA